MRISRKRDPDDAQPEYNNDHETEYLLAHTPFSFLAHRLKRSSTQGERNRFESSRARFAQIAAGSAQPSPHADELPRALS
jgi:hypothetical protein